MKLSVKRRFVVNEKAIDLLKDSIRFWIDVAAGEASGDFEQDPLCANLLCRHCPVMQMHGQCAEEGSAIMRFECKTYPHSKAKTAEHRQLAFEYARYLDSILLATQSEDCSVTKQDEVVTVTIEALQVLSEC